jgi:hypothetical protein
MGAAGMTVGDVANAPPAGCLAMPGASFPFGPESEAAMIVAPPTAVIAGLDPAIHEIARRITIVGMMFVELPHGCAGQARA